MAGWQHRKAIPTGEQVEVRGVMFDMQRLEPVSMPPPTRKAPSPPPSINEKAEGQLSEIAKGKQREDLGYPCAGAGKYKDKEYEVEKEIAKAMKMAKEKENEIEMEIEKLMQKDDRRSLPSYKRRPYQRVHSVKGRKRATVVLAKKKMKRLSVMSVIGEAGSEESVGSEEEYEGVVTGDWTEEEG